MPATRMFLAVFATIALLALPAAALAQSAGDEQYTDPLQGAPQQQAPAPEQAPTPAPESPDTTGSAPAPVDPGTGVAPDGTSGAAGDGATAGTAAGGASTLPYTGIDARLPLSAGAILLGLGMLVRLRLSGPFRS